MRNIRLLVEYEGTDYAGWQAQKNGPSIQGSIVEAVKRLTGEETTVNGASRTDAGVHAYGQVACFNTASAIPPANFRSGLNMFLPDDIVVKEAVDVPLDFDPRRRSLGKTYVYRVLNRPYPSSLLRRFAWHVARPLDIELMRDAAVHMIGEKDFTSLRSVESDALHSMREVRSIDISAKDGELIEFEVKGNAFLRHMVRIMVGTLVDVGRGRITAGDIPSIIDDKDRRSAGMTAPPHGLTLMKVDY